MSGLTAFKRYLNGRKKVLQSTAELLESLLQKYEKFFAEVSKVREQEMGQIAAQISAGADLPEALRIELDQAMAKAREGYLTQLEKIRNEAMDAEKQAEVLRSESAELERELHLDNNKLDDEEETLKARNQKYLEQVEDFNQRIASMGKGVGFFTNLFKMHTLNAQRNKLIETQADLAARIEGLRQTWQSLDKSQRKHERLLQSQWIEARAKASALRAKLEQLEAMPERVIQRSALEQVLFSRTPKMRSSKVGDPPCPRCAVANASTNHFCRVCGQRLQPDRLDVLGSLDEVAELNLHHQAFAQGVKSAQELLGMLRGLAKGIQTFNRSIDDMISSQNTHGLAVLSVDVPEKSQAYADQFEKLAETLAQSEKVPPQAFAALVENQVEQVYCKEKIESFFATMGAELTRQAELQW